LAKAEEVRTKDHDDLADEIDEDESKKGKQLVYEGPFQMAVRMTKVLSISSCILTSTGAPLLAYAEPSSTSYALAGLIMTFGLATTTLLNLAIKPYIRRAWFDYSSLSDPKVDPALEIEQITLFGRLKKTVISASEIEVPESIMRPMTTFYVKNTPFFISYELFPDQELLAKFIELPYPAQNEESDEEEEEPESERKPVSEKDKRNQC